MDKKKKVKNSSKEATGANQDKSKVVSGANQNKSKVASGANQDKSTKSQNVPIFMCCCSFLSGLVVLVLAVLAFRVYENVTHVPDMAPISLDTWWGPNSTRDNQDTSIRPFRIVFDEAMVADLRTRFDNYRRLKKTKTLENAAWTFGVNSDGFGQVFAHWIFKYQFSERQRLLNKYEHFKTNIQGLDIHFVHVKPQVDSKVKVLPLLLLHGWPGSFREFYDVIPLLTTPRAGYDFVFELIIPSLAGFGYSDGAVRPGLSTVQMGVIMRNLMHRIGHKRYYVQGGDMGFFVGSSMATLFPEEVLGFHSNMAMVMGKKTLLVWALGSLWPSWVAGRYADRMYPLKDKLSFYLEESGYMHLQSTKPDTIGVALNESPAGLAAYILEKFVTGTNHNNKYVDDGGLDKLKFDDLLDNIMIYWATGSMTTAMRLYKERIANRDLEYSMSIIPTEVPTWALQLKYELFFLPEFILKWKYVNLLGTTTLDEGGHFAAFELPQVFANDLFKAVLNFIKFHEAASFNHHKGK